METYFPCLEVSFTSCQICLLCLCTNVTYSLSLATDLKQNSERTNSITQHIFCRGNQWESFQRLPPPEAICPYVTFCAHCTCPFYLSVTVPCLSILSIILSPSLLSRFHSMPSVQLSRTIPYRFLSLHFPFTQLYIFHLLSSICLSVFISAGRHISSQNGVLWPLPWYSKQSEDITNCMFLPSWNVFLTYVATSASVSWTPLLFSPVFHCFGGRSTVYYVYSNPIWCRFQLLNLNLMQVVCRFQRSTFKDVKIFKKEFEIRKIVKSFAKFSDFKDFLKFLMRLYRADLLKWVNARLWNPQNFSFGASLVRVVRLSGCST